MNILYIFIDGIGFGEQSQAKNPFTRFSKSYLSPLGYQEPNVPNGWLYKEIDAHLGIDGLPQSATGQTSLWTGINGARVMGHHKTGFPGPTLIKVLENHSIIKQFHDKGLKSTLVNAYSQKYMDRISRHPRFKSASTYLQLSSGQKLKTLNDLENKNAIYMDITHEIMHKLLPEQKKRFPIIEPQVAGLNLLNIAKKNDLSIYEFFLSDKAGHDFNWELAQWVIETLEGFIQGICENIDIENDTLVITSDHGNMEDLTTKSHTHNPVPLFVYGKDAQTIFDFVQNIADIPKIIYNLSGLSFDEYSYANP